MDGGAEAARSRADEIVALTGCSISVALLAAMTVPAPADIEDAVDVVLSTMSCCHPRIVGAEAPRYGVSDLRRPYAAATNGWEVLSGSARLCPLTPLPVARGLLLADGATLLLDRGEATAVPLPSDSICLEDSKALLCIEIAIKRTEYGPADDALPASLYVRLSPNASYEEERAVWAIEDSVPTDVTAGTRRGRAIVPCQRPNSGWLSPPDAETCMCRSSVQLSLEPLSGDSTAVPSISVQWARSADLLDASTRRAALSRTAAP